MGLQRYALYRTILSMPRVTHICLFRYELPSALEAVAIPTEEELEKERARREDDQVRFMQKPCVKLCQ